MPNTILLDVTTWDYTVDAAGNWAMASEPYALAQDVSSAIRLIQGELWYDDSQGIPYFQKILRQPLTLAEFQDFMVNAALTVPNVVSATCVVESYSATTRAIVGQVQFTDANDNTGAISLGG
jgi:hypothetical protein